MKYAYNKFLIIITLCAVFAFASCTEEDALPFEVYESPVLAVFDGSEFPSTGNIEVTATFYDLDKSGILDQNVGIDSVEVPNLSVQVLINGSQEVANLTTDNSGKAILNQPWSSVGGPGRVRLEWVGSYDNRTFRIFHIIELAD